MIRICRFCETHLEPLPHAACYGVLEESHVIPIRGDSPFGSLELQRENRIPLQSVRLLAPCEPTKIVAVGRNYREHIAEMGHDVPAEPLIFLKPPSAIIGPGEEIQLPSVSQRVDYEGELVVVIRRRASKITEKENPLDYVLGYTCGNDVTARDLQKKDVQFTRAKGFDSFAPLGPVIATQISPTDLLIETRVNGQVRQRARTRDLLFPVDFLVRYISQIMTLLPGDVIFTGTPAGVGPLQPGDWVEVEIEGIGVLANPVTASH